MRREVVNNDKNLWRVTFMKVIDDSQVIYYRLINLNSYKVIDVPAYKIFDEIVNNHMNIENVRCNKGKLYVITEDGYDGTDEIIVIDEFKKDAPTIYEWAIQNSDRGCVIIKNFDPGKNLCCPSSFSIECSDSIAWTCEQGHTVYMDFQSYVSIGCSCPICKDKENNRVLSFKAWSRLTRNEELLNMFRTSEFNKVDSSEIAYDSKREVWWHMNDEDVSTTLHSITVKNEDIPFKTKKARMINLSRKRNKNV